MMKNKLLILILLFVYGANHYSIAQNSTTTESQNNPTDSSQQSYADPISVRDTIAIGDSIIVIHTVCAPICSSYAHVYNKEGEKIGSIEAPFKSAFPEAYIENNRILWRDNDPFDYTPVP